MATIGYARVSTVGQSLETQLAQLEQYQCDQIFQEKVSGATLNRPEFDALLHYVIKGDVVVVCKLDRLARSTKDLLQIVEQLSAMKVSLKILNMNLDTSTPTGKLMLTMLGAIAEFERELMLERQAEGIARAKVNGKYKGKPPQPLAVQEKVLTMAKSGLTKQKVAIETGLSLRTVYRILGTM